MAKPREYLLLGLPDDTTGEGAPDDSRIQPPTRDETLSCALKVLNHAQDDLIWENSHGNRTSKYSEVLGRNLGLSDAEKITLRRGARLHDIGTTTLPQQILRKAGPLTPEELDVIQQHPLLGERICASVDSFEDVLPIVRHHHERFDGSGYPDGLQGEEIPLAARIVQIAEVYDALRSPRFYRDALSPFQVIQMMQRAADNGWHDPEIFAEFRRIIEWEYRIGRVISSYRSEPMNISTFKISG